MNLTKVMVKHSVVIPPKVIVIKTEVKNHHHSHHHSNRIIFINKLTQNYVIGTAYGMEGIDEI